MALVVAGRENRPMEPLKRPKLAPLVTALLVPVGRCRSDPAPRPIERLTPPPRRLCPAECGAQWPPWMPGTELCPVCSGPWAAHSPASDSMQPEPPRLNEVPTPAVSDGRETGREVYRAGGRKRDVLGRFIADPPDLNEPEPVPTNDYCYRRIRAYWNQLPHGSRKLFSRQLWLPARQSGVSPAVAQRFLYAVREAKSSGADFLRQCVGASGISSLASTPGSCDSRASKDAAGRTVRPCTGTSSVHGDALTRLAGQVAVIDLFPRSVRGTSYPLVIALNFAPLRD